MKIASPLNNALVVACCKKTHFLPLHQIIRLEARSCYTVIYSLHHYPLTVAKVLSDFEEELVSLGFLRVHRSHLVNRQHIEGIDLRGNIIMHDQKRVEVPRRRKKEIRHQLASYGPGKRGNYF